MRPERLHRVQHAGRSALEEVVLQAIILRAAPHSKGPRRVDHSPRNSSPDQFPPVHTVVGGLNVYGRASALPIWRTVLPRSVPTFAEPSWLPVAASLTTAPLLDVTWFRFSTGRRTGRHVPMVMLAQALRRVRRHLQHLLHVHGCPRTRRASPR